MASPMIVAALAMLRHGATDETPPGLSEAAACAA